MATDGSETPLGTLELVREIVQTGTLLVEKEIELARAELKADLRAHLLMAKRLVVAAALAVLGVNLLLVAVVLAFANVMPGWLAALALGALLLAVAGIIGLVAWQRRARTPLAVTRRNVKEALEW